MEGTRVLNNNMVNVNSYLNTELSPYRLNDDAMKLIEHLCENFSQKVEEKALVLINAASLHPKMSRYQLSLTHKALGDCYYKHKFFQSALEQYNRAISYNSKIAVKRRIKKLSAIPSDKRASSLSPDVISDVLQFPEYKELLKRERALIQTELDALWRDNLESRALVEQAREQITSQSDQEKFIYDLEHEAEIERRLNALGEPYKSEFYRIREERQLTKEPDDILSLKDQELLDLESMERSATFSKNIVTTRMKEALSSACHFIQITESIECVGKSHQGLIKFLVIGGGYTNEEATYAVDNCKVDWNEQAIKTARYYKNKYPSMSHQEIIEQLIFEGFTEAQAKYGVNYVMTNNGVKVKSLPEGMPQKLYDAGVKALKIMDKYNDEGINVDEVVNELMSLHDKIENMDLSDELNKDETYTEYEQALMIQSNINEYNYALFCIKYDKKNTVGSDTYTIADELRERLELD